ncbi:ankyrin repeat-containing domain protein [Chytriomyces sp. MP71]|nr:ankyrin repeat-containing domain protein [Chytriomyces sp. MP71]
MSGQLEVCFQTNSELSEPQAARNMSGKGFGSPLFSKRKTSTSAAPSVTEGHDPKRLSANDKSGKLDPPALQRHIRGASTASNESAQSAVVPPPAVNINADVSAMTIDRIRAPTYIESKKLNSLQQAVHSGDMRKVKSLLQEKSRDVNKLDTYHGFSALHVAVDENKYDIAALLIHPVSSLPEKDVKMRELFETSPLKRINMNLTNREGRTALIVAVIRGYSDLVHLLIKNKAQLDVQDLLGCTALHYSILIGDISSFRLLLDARAKQSVVDKV